MLKKMFDKYISVSRPFCVYSVWWGTHFLSVWLVSQFPIISRVMTVRVQFILGYVLGLTMLWIGSSYREIVPKRFQSPWLIMSFISYGFGFFILNHWLKVFLPYPLVASSVVYLVVFTLFTYFNVKNNVLDNSLFRFKNIWSGILFFLWCYVFLRMITLSVHWSDLVNQETYARVAAWLDVANCFQKTKIILVGCGSDALIRFEQLSTGDDVGPCLWLSWIAKLVNVVPSREFSMMVGLGMRGVWLVLFCVFLYILKYSRTFMFSAFTLGMVFLTSSTYISPDAPTYYWSAWIGSIMLPWGLVVGTQEQSLWRKYSTLAIGFLGLIYALMTREPIGKIGIVISCGVLLYQCYQNISMSLLLKTLILWVIIGIIQTNVPKVFYVWRELQSPYPIALQTTGSHGISHNLLIGLGTEPNSFGLHWDDRDGFRIAERIQPGVKPYSEQYFKILQGVYWNIVRNHPVEVFLIYIKKTLRVFFPETFLFFLFFSAFFYKIQYKNILFKEQWKARCQSVCGVLSLSVVLNAAQGVLACPGWMLYYPIYFGLALIGCLLIDVLGDL